MEYIMSNGEEQNTKEDILDMMESLDTFVKLMKMVNASEKAVSNKRNGGNQNLKKSNGKSNSEANKRSNNQKKNPCMTHEGKHDWSKCPNNKFSKSFKGNNGGKPINIDGAEKKENYVQERYQGRSPLYSRRSESGQVQLL
jgi:hypothetical protein